MNSRLSELSLRTTWHVTWHVAHDKHSAVARDLHTIAPGPLEQCTRRSEEIVKNLELRLWMWLLLVLILLLLFLLFLLLLLLLSLDKWFLCHQVESFSLTIQARDSGSPMLYSTAVVEVVINDANDNPPMFDNSSYIAKVQVRMCCFCCLISC